MGIQDEDQPDEGHTTTRRAERADWGDFPAVIRNADLKSLEREPEYRAAKAGDREAALALIERVLTDVTIDAVGQQLEGNNRRDVRIVPVIAVEAAGRNKLPLMMAEVLAEHLGVEVEYGIIQVDRGFRTGATADHRLAFSPAFDGDVTLDRSYFIVDDTLSIGGTIASLRGHICNRGGVVLGAAVMTAHAGALHLPVTRKMLDGIRAKHGDEMQNFWQQEFNYGIEKLTNGEAGHLRAAASVDAIRIRIAAARNAAGRTMGQAEAGQEGSPLALTDYRSYRNSQIDRARNALSIAQDTLWEHGDILPHLRIELEQHAAARGTNPKEFLESVLTENPRSSDFTRRIANAINSSAEATTLAKSLRQARRHYQRQLRRPDTEEFTPGSGEVHDFES